MVSTNALDNEEIARVARSLDQKLSQAGLATKISIAEAGQLDYLYTRSSKPNRGAQLSSFFDPSSLAALLDLKHLDHHISGHSYFTTSSYDKAVRQRKQFSDSLEAVRKRASLHNPLFKDLGYWMSEYCILGDNAGEIDGNKRDLGMEAALYLARVMHMDLCFGNAAAWHWWLAMSCYDYKDGLIYVDKSTSTAQYHESKMLWVMGNFSRFVRPGFVRIENKLRFNEHQGAALKDSLLVSSFKAPSTNHVVVVAINLSRADQWLSVADTRLSDLYICSERAEDNLRRVKAPRDHGPILLKARSVMTLLGEL